MKLMDSFDRIYLVGMPSSGKSRLGSQLSELLHLTFYDLDKIIEEEEKKTIQQIFEQKGEDYFRSLESHCLKKHLAEKYVMATGGGTPCYHKNIDFMKKNGVVVFLDVPIHTLESRLKESNLDERPKLKQSNLGKLLKSILRKRNRYYIQSHLSVFGENISVSDLHLSLKKSSES